MRHSMTVLFCVCLSLAPLGVPAQVAGPQALTIGPSGAAYLDAVRYRGVDADVGYYDPVGAMPQLEARLAPPPQEDPAGKDGAADAFSTGRILVILLALAILTGLAALVLRNAGNFSLSLQSEAQNPERRRKPGLAVCKGLDGPPADLQAILATTDRRHALVMLARAALARTVAANGVLLQPSWTMRDTLSHIPKAQSHLDALRNLVIAGEKVLFGNRDVSEVDFQAQVAAIRPILTGTVT